MSKDSFEGNSDRFSITNPVVELQVDRRFDAWYKACSSYVTNKLPKNNLVQYEANKPLLYLCAKAQNDSINKFELYSESDGVEDVKRAAFAVKWISKIKPIQIPEELSSNEGRKIIKDNLDLEYDIYQANNDFAINIGISLIQDFFVPYIKTQEYKDYIKKIKYDLTYRNISGRQFTMVVRMLTDLSKAYENNAQSI